MIRRRDTLGFIDFMRGKYSVYDKSYIANMIVQMTVDEKRRLLTQPFSDIWRELWGGEPVSLNMQYRNEEQISRDKFNTLRSGVLLKHDFYTLETLVQTTMQDLNNNNNTSIWEYAEWGFPKGRRNYQEKDYDCAVREFCEETGYTQYADKLVSIQNIMPFEEIFMGSNYKSYKHKYYLTHMPYEESIREYSVQSSEVSCAEWKTYEDCMASIRHYNVEKKRMLENVHQTILRYL
jgi:8-oxo-dGTP pyrophosphatase MutT (NUDIX family)